MSGRSASAWWWVACAAALGGGGFAAWLIGCDPGSAATANVPAARYLPHPDDPSRQVEYYVESPPGPGPWPTVVLLHGHQDTPGAGGRDFAEWGVLAQLAGRGYLAVAVSQPGYGASAGPADFCGPFTQHAVRGVIAHLRAEGAAAPDRLVIEGISRGALTAGLIAADDSSVTGLVLISGVYDLPAWAADPGPGLVKRALVATLRAETGGTDEALQARSVARGAARIRASTLVLAGALDDRTDPGQARALADAIVRAGGQARAIVYPDVGHRIPVAERNADVDPFLDRVLGGR